MLDDIINSFRASPSLLILTGAGVSAESGIPTFRDALTGLWAKFNPEDLATPEAFNRDPQLVSHWYDQRRVDCGKMGVALGPDVVPLVLEDLRRTHDLWFWALRYLNHRMDVAADAGTHDDKVAAWLAWGIDRGYISDA